jgi:GTPase
VNCEVVCRVIARYRESQKDTDIDAAVDSNTTTNHIDDVRIAIAGNVDSGKSTLVGVLCAGVQDNGRGLARSRIFLHRHEADNGRTSCISQHTLGYNVQNQPVFQSVAASTSSLAKTKSWSACVAASRNIVTLIDRKLQ